MNFKKSLIIGSVGILLASMGSLTVSAVSIDESQQITSHQTEHINSDENLATKIANIGSYISFEDDSENLQISLSDQELKEHFNFDSLEIEQLHMILNGEYDTTIYNSETNNSVTTFSTQKSGKRLYLSNHTLTAGAASALLIAAQTSPAALKASFVALSTSVGPIGTLVAAGAAGFGASFFADLALKITGAVAQGKGVAFYFDWGWPPVSSAIE